MADTSLATMVDGIQTSLNSIKSIFERRLPFIELVEYINSEKKLLALWPIVDGHFYRSNHFFKQYLNCQRWLMKYMYKNCKISAGNKEEVNFHYMNKLVRELLLEAEEVESIFADLYDSIEFDYSAFHDLWEKITGVTLYSGNSIIDARISVKAEIKSKFMTLDAFYHEQKQLYLHRAEKELSDLPDDVKTAVLDVFADNLHSRIFQNTE